MERAVAKICREAGARVKERVKVVDLNGDTAVDDQRELEVVAAGLRCFKGRQLVVDVTVRSVLAASGEARPRTHWNIGVVADGAR